MKLYIPIVSFLLFCALLPEAKASSSVDTVLEKLRTAQKILEEVSGTVTTLWNAVSNAREATCRAVSAGNLDSYRNQENLLLEALNGARENCAGLKETCATEKACLEGGAVAKERVKQLDRLLRDLRLRHKPFKLTRDNICALEKRKYQELANKLQLALDAAKDKCAVEIAKHR